ncbi:hypothetical protein UCRPC4_g03599 [Phaeomoniella chlamydospora]|uniref:HAUS augmin-like complex subunit 6 N-terminal domain-containing protein n=1 Tax=Phaeomoniella chlamydospora TaxID=158046 RepID=A0A0G2GXW9_PHACM|nr:hypothetical protein UCRPC4_g03599 [Phaeomoniella chlamydospora]
MTSLGRSVSTRVPKNQDSGEQPSWPAAAKWHGPTHITTFLRVIRLLNLDKLEDWPGISEATFSGRAVSQNLQQKLKGTEWALYRLFELWDPQETGDKLKPFFPPLAPLQSKNLRAALFRCLSDVKRDGFLGREAVLRKTMLDECKGEKFEEVLSSFAMAVLRKVTLQSHSGHDRMMNIALAPANKLPLSRKDLLLPMMIAQTYGIRRTLQEMSDIHEDHIEQQKGLSDTQATILASLKDLHQQKEAIFRMSESEQAEAERLVSLFEASWDGDPNWLKEILEAPSARRVGRDTLKRHGLVDETPISHTTSLLEDLESRIASHRSRLRSWRNFQRSIAQELETSHPLPNRRRDGAKSRNSPLFTQHQSLNLNLRLFDTGMEPLDSSDQFSHYLDISDSLGKEIAAIENGRSRRTEKDRDDQNDRKHLQLPEKRAPKPVTDIGKHGLGIESYNSLNSDTFAMDSVSDSRKAPAVEILADSPIPVNDRAALKRSKKSAGDLEQPKSSIAETLESKTIDPTSTTLTQSDSPTIPISSPPTGIFKDMSISHTSIDDTDQFDHDISPPLSPTPLPDLTSTTKSKPSTRLPIETLLERTRQSMSLLLNPPSSSAPVLGISKDKKQQRPHLPHQRSSHTRTRSRPSFPVNPWETPSTKPRPSSIMDTLPQSPSETRDQPDHPNPQGLSPFAPTGLLRHSPISSPIRDHIHSPKTQTPPDIITSPAAAAATTTEEEPTLPSPYIISPQQKQIPQPSHNPKSPLPPNHHQNQTQHLHPTIHTPTKPHAPPRPQNLTPSPRQDPLDLFSSEADYDSVFKSRPKLKYSPVVDSTPVMRSGLGVGMGYGYADDGDGDGQDGSWID